jgi:hypothetical protein
MIDPILKRLLVIAAYKLWRDEPTIKSEALLNKALKDIDLEFDKNVHNIRCGVDKRDYPYVYIELK